MSDPAGGGRLFVAEALFIIRQFGFYSHKISGLAELRVLALLHATAPYLRRDWTPKQILDPNQSLNGHNFPGTFLISSVAAQADDHMMLASQG